MTRIHFVRILRRNCICLSLKARFKIRRQLDSFQTCDRVSEIAGKGYLSFQHARSLWWRFALRVVLIVIPFVQVHRHWSYPQVPF